MLYIAISTGVVAVYLFIRHLTYKRELSKINSQLARYNDLDTEKKVDVSLSDAGIEQLGAEINRLIDLYVKAERDRVRSENELKQAVANISHDLRTPLTSIKGYIQMAASVDAGETKQREYLDIAAGRTKRLEQLVDDFFELSRIESADYELSPETFDLKRHFREVLLGFYTSFEERTSSRRSPCRKTVFLYTPIRLRLHGFWKICCRTPSGTATGKSAPALRKVMTV